MMHLAPILAEVGDKEPTILAIWAISGFFCIMGLLIAKWRRTAALLPLTLSGLWAWALCSELRDVAIGPAILRELGWGYVVQAYMAALVPFLFIAVGLYMRGSSRRGAGDGGVTPACSLCRPDHDRWLTGAIRCKG